MTIERETGSRHLIETTANVAAPRTLGLRRNPGCAGSITERPVEGHPGMIGRYCNANGRMISWYQKAGGRKSRRARLSSMKRRNSRKNRK